MVETVSGLLTFNCKGQRVFCLAQDSPPLPAILVIAKAYPRSQGHHGRPVSWPLSKGNVLCGDVSLTVFVMKTGHSSSLLPSTTTSDSASQEGYESRGGMLDWNNLLEAPGSTDPLGAVSSHNHQDKKGKALEVPLPRGSGGRGVRGGGKGEDCVPASS